ncbi:MAG: DUF4126 domain-containing protein [Planctomycetaceae bacterium]|nr:DUF4126 domain-containing protein [Planctomycetaceae bacterium]
MPEFEIILSICLGVGLAAACGFRVFVPMLGVSTAALAGHVDLAYGFEWLGTWPAMACFLTATILEIAAYYVPWIDNLLDSIATPAAVVAGTIVAASVITDMSPMMQWTLAIIAGGGAAALVQTSTVALRGASTAATGGTANFLVATAELVASVCTTVLALLLPMICLALVLLTGGLILYRANRHRQPAALVKQGV